MDGFKLTPSDPVPPQGATKFPPPPPATAKQVWSDIKMRHNSNFRYYFRKKWKQ